MYRAELQRSIPSEPQRAMQAALVYGSGSEFDSALHAAVNLQPAERNRVLEQTLEHTAQQLYVLNQEPGLMPGAAPRVLNNYLGRLRLARLAAAREGAANPTVVYPLVGYDAMPSLFFSSVLGIDPMVSFDHAPIDPSFYRGGTLVRQMQQRGLQVFDRRLRSVFDRVATEPRRHTSLGSCAFDLDVAAHVRGRCNGPAMLFIKGLEWLNVHYAFGNGRAVKPAPHGLGSAAEAGLWFARHYTQQGDFVVVHERDARTVDAFVEDSRYEEMPFDFLDDHLRAKVTGSAVSINAVITPIYNPRFSRLALSIPNAMRMFKVV